MGWRQNQKEALDLKKEGKIAKVYRLSQEGVSVKEIAEKTKLNERLVRSYIWRMQNPQKYKALVDRYFEKKKGKEVLATGAEAKPVKPEKKEKKKKAQTEIQSPQQ
jgi:hypothetical protein